MKPIAQISLYYSEGNSDKEYHAEIVAVAGGNVVNFRYGRRGGALTVGSKTSAPVDFAQAKKIFDQLVKQKTAKGYTPDVSGIAYQGTEHAGLKTDFTPQLLNPISEEEAMRLIENDSWIAQEKMDGERRAAHAIADSVTGMNRKGLSVPLPKPLADELQNIAAASGALRVDGEIIGTILHVFDLHILHGISLHQHLGWLDRMRQAERIFADSKQIKPVPVAVTTKEKQALWETVKAAHGEGVVFKRIDSFVTAGRPSTGGDWLKFKFTESASFCVMAVNAGKRSVKIGLRDFTGLPDVTKGKLVPVGNVTIPPNHAVPAAGEIVEVEYLYAYHGGSLYQPVYRGKRTDLDLDACTTVQLKYKPAGYEDDEG